MPFNALKQIEKFGPLLSFATVQNVCALRHVQEELAL